MLAKEVITDLLVIIGLTCSVVETGDHILFERVERADRRSPPRRQRPRSRFPFPWQPPRQRFPFPPKGRVPDTGPPNPVTDPADISHMLGHCSMGNRMDMASVFQSMFVSNSEVDTLVNEAKTNLRNSNRRNGKKKSFIESNRMSKTIGRTNPLRSPNGGTDCCETEMRMTAPYIVLESGKRMQVVHMNSSYQFVHEGVCVSPRAKCRATGSASRCTNIPTCCYMIQIFPIHSLLSGLVGCR